MGARQKERETESQAGSALSVQSPISSFLIKKKFFFNVFIYFWDRERQSMSRGRTDREGGIESEAGSRL